MPYQYVRIKTQGTEDRWVQAVEVQPTEPAVVHHVLVFVQSPGEERLQIDERSGPFAAYVPGNSYSRYPPGFAKRLPAGASLVFQLHYTPYGTAAGCWMCFDTISIGSWSIDWQNRWTCREAARSK